ncbi:MAG TPA: rhodanese-like domain-containing protein [Quisquiliibacterium sp.]|nr:rhodanese-like domain-containing protein [Quisquiliibacterium sp.]HPA88136.1 rhodanese-like domain-containing protein [Quisquiliibacterium sp.]HQD81597.1 rhodanese-like domain-containing protein [Quisquiliibacterium sp.]HQN11013.1 rhodanese-like domain-containing protein [Quisquiliibacterium sp.]HQP65358.1 rhodanese-like domain-containing protein [Quisquiliibacterium sp.]
MQHLTPREAHAFLQCTPDALFVDCRTDAEFFFVGHPVGAIHVALLEGPEWTPNPRFVDEVRSLAGHAYDRPVVVICRSGRRSVDACKALEEAGFRQVYDVLHGFEGDLDEHRQRGRRNGWRFDGLPWEQM